MIAHISIGVRDIDRSKRFYDAALEPLGYKCLRAARTLMGYGYGRDSIALWVVQAEHPVPADEKSGLHFRFTAANASAVDAFHAAALRSGGHDIPMFTAIGAVVTFERELMVEGFRPACGRSKAMPAGGRDDSIGVTEVLFRAILNGAHAFHGPLVMHVDVHAHPGIGRRALFFGIIAPVIRQVGVRHIVRQRVSLEPLRAQSGHALPHQ
jgi:catechol 2,3-dioxygenase-like lactoylglutathione lyase family enzyme